MVASSPADAKEASKFCVYVKMPPRRADIAFMSTFTLTAPSNGLVYYYCYKVPIAYFVCLYFADLVN